MLKKTLLTIKKIITNKGFHLFVGAIILISIYLYFKSVQEDFSDIFILDNPKYLLLAIPFLLYSLISHALAWRIIINQFDITIGFWQSIYIYFFSNLTRYIPGNYWHLIFKSTIGIKYGIDFSTGIKGTGIEIVLNTLVGFVFVLLGITLNIIQLKSEQYLWLGIFFLIGILFFLFFLLLEKKTKAQESKNKNGTQSLLSTLRDELSKLKNFPLKKIATLILLFSSAWVSQGFTFFFVLSMWNLTEFSNYFLIMFSYVTAWFLGFINPIAQNGLGVREAVFMITISNVFQIPVILGGGIMMRIIGILGELLLMFLGWFVIRDKKKTD